MFVISRTIVGLVYTIFKKNYIQLIGQTSMPPVKELLGLHVRTYHYVHGTRDAIYVMLLTQSYLELLLFSSKKRIVFG